MKAKNIKYYLTPLLLALNISLVGCGSEKNVEIVDTKETDISNEDEIEIIPFNQILSSNLEEEKVELPSFEDPFHLKEESKSTEELNSFDQILQEGLKEPEEKDSTEEATESIETPEEKTEATESLEEDSRLTELKELAIVKEIYIIGNSKDDGYEIQFTSKNDSLNYLVREGVDDTREYLDTLIFTDESSVNFLNCEDLEIMTAISHPEIIKSLGMKRCSTTDLSCLEAFKNLENLRIQSCPSLENIDTLGCLTKLQGFQMLGTNVSDIHSLSYLKDIVLLDLRCNQITDVSPLQDLSRLQYIYLEYNRIEDAESLRFLEEKGLISEYERYIIPATYWNSDIRITLKKYENQTHFHQLKIQKLDSKEDWYGGGYFVEVYDNQGNLCAYSLVNKFDDPYYFENTYDNIVLLGVKDLSMLEKIENKDTITKIDIQSCSLSSLEGIDAFQNVTGLTITNCDQLSEIPELSNMPNLSTVVIKNTPITEINSLSNLKDLEYLWLSYTYVDDISPIFELSSLKQVYYLWNKRTVVEDMLTLEEKVPHVEWVPQERTINEEKVKEYTE